MSLVGKIQSLFLDREKTQPIFPITKVKAVSDDNGKGLNVLLDEKASADKVFHYNDYITGNNDFNTATTQGFYYCNTWTGSGGSNFPNGQDTGMMFVIHVADSYIQQIYISDTEGIIRRMKWADEAEWKPWEYENPTMATGKEYRTTERWRGYAVYTRLIEIGNYPATGSTAWKGFGTGYGITKILRVCAVDSGGVTIPYYEESLETRVSGTVSNGQAFVAVSVVKGDFTAKTCTVQVWYVKE